MSRGNFEDLTGMTFGDYTVIRRATKDEINKRGGDAEFFEDREQLKRRIDELIKPGDIILILGPEDIRTLGDELCRES